MASSHGMKMSLQDNFLFDRPTTTVPAKRINHPTLKRPHTANPSGIQPSPWVNPNAISSSPHKKFNISLNHKSMESKTSKKAPYAARLNAKTNVWDHPKVVNGKVFSMPEYSSLDDPHLTSYFERKLGMKPNLSSGRPKVKKTVNTQKRIVYNVVIVTGTCKNASTNANVYVQIRGTKGKIAKQQLVKKDESEEMNITDIGFTFKKGSRESFSIRSPDIGQVIALDIEHDGVERNKSWYLEEIIVRNQRTKEQWTLPCQCWLSLYEGDCQVKRVLKPASGEKTPERVIYEIEVLTGNNRGAGTDAHVFITMFGNVGSTGRVQLVNRNINTFERGQTDVFKIKVKYLGKIQRVMIDHDNTGFAPGWLLDRIIITNLSNPKERRYFVCNKWLSKDDDDGEISRLLLGTSSLDNVAQSHKYTISTYTGNVRGAGTDATVYITLFSKNGSSTEMKLNDSSNNFERKKIDVFNVECPILGELSRVRIRHNNKGVAAGWFLDKVTVKDGESKLFEFPCGRWLSVSEDDGQISRDLVLLGGDGDLASGIPYRVNITTGDLRGAGTDAKVYVIMYGGKEGGDISGKLWVQNGEKNNFDRGKTDLFHVECAEELSPLHHLTIGHNNKGTAAGWFCESVIIEAPTTGIVQTFFCRQWLADDEGDGLFERDLFEDIDYRKQREKKNVWNVAVHTSDIRAAGTDANVYFILYGDKGNSEVKPLGNKTDNFEQGNVDKFNVDIKDVGIPFKMIIGHDNAKLYSDWHLDKVFLENSVSKENYSFTCGRWIGPDEDDGQCVRELPANGKDIDPLPLVPYKVSVYTGDKRGSGTDANVFINIFGELGDTHDRPLIKSAHNFNKFERNQVDEFIVEAVHLSELTSIRIGHDGKGSKDGWYLEKVIITDPRSKKDYPFLCERWLASDEDDGLIVREIGAGDTATLLKTTSYHISVKTGDVRGAGTDANVYINIFGENKDTGKLQLRQSQNIKDKWERGRTCLFTIEAMDIGKIKKLLIGHDGKGVGAGWYLDSVILDVPSHGQQVKFACNRWLAEDEEDGMIVRVLYPSDEFSSSKKVPYEVEVHTGDTRGAGTNSNVFVVLYGEEKKSEEFWLRTKTDNFERKAVDKFKIEAGEIGVLTKLRVGHDNAGFNSAWFLDKIIIRHLKAPEKPDGKKSDKKRSKKTDDSAEDDDCIYVFPCNRWLAKDEDDGQIIRELLPHTTSGKLRKNSLASNTYIVHVYTGDIRSSGTNSNVFLTIYGEKGDTGERELKKSETNFDKFERNQEDIFKIDAVSVGKVAKAKIRHDNSGMKPSWFLDRLEVQDTLDKVDFILPCNQWLSKTEDDGAISRELVAVGRDEFLRRRQRTLSRAGSIGSGGGDNIDLEQMSEKTTYNIEVETGDVSGAGTDANVFVILFGEKGDSGKIDLKMSKSNKNKFERNQMDVFNAEAVDIGNLERVRIGHDNKGGFAGWFLDNVVVDAPSVGCKWKFPAARWLDKSKDDGKIEIDLYPLTDKTEKYEKYVPYEIVVYTSDIQGAGSDSNIFIQLYGMTSIATEQIFLTDTNKKRRDCFNRGSVDIFVRELTDIGEHIDKIRIGHDNKGFGAAWHLDKVEIRKLTDGDGDRRSSAGSVSFVFSCKRWFAKGEDDGAIVRELVPIKITSETVDSDGKVSVNEHRVDALAVHNYKVHIFTGDIRSAGTDANVFITLIGENGDSGERQLSVSETHRDKFERGQEDVFSIEAVELGYIRKVVIRHDDSNLNSDWFLDKVEVLDTSEEQRKYVFSCERWLAKKKDNGKLKRSLYEKSYEGDRASCISSSTTMYGSGMLSDNDSIASGKISRKSSVAALSRSETADKVFESDVKGKMKRSLSKSSISSPLKIIPYTVRVSTGDKSEHSTEANAFIVFIGTEDVSEKIPLELIGKDKFEPLSIETFSLESADYGDIKKIEFGHDGYRPKDSWYVKSVEVDQPTSGCKYFFPCECWLGQDKEDGKTFRIFSVDETKDVTYKPKIPFNMTIYTGDVKNAGTDSEIKFSLVGDSGETRDMILDKADDRFERNSIDTIHIDADDVGTITKLNIGTNGKGSRSHWFLDKVCLLNLNTEKTTVFKCGQWLSKSEGDGKLIRELPAEVDGKKITEEISYNISVHTGSKRGCGTDANVFLIIFGEKGNSGELALKESITNKDKFERGQTDVFEYNLLSLGKLTKVRVWHDNKYMRSGWFLSSIDIIDNKENETYKFPCERWLAKDEDDGSLMRELACGNNDSTSKSKENLTLTGYEVTITTSDKANAGTPHNAMLVFIDKDGKKSEELLAESSSKKKLFSRGQTDTIKFVTEPLSVLKTLIISLQKRKGVKSEDDSLKWHLQKVSVKDIEADEEYEFECNQWLQLTSTKDSIKQFDCSKTNKSMVVAIRELKPVQYEVKVFTADVAHAGTDANVFMILYGENGDTGRRELKKKFRDLFERGNMDDFKIEALDLGKLTKLFIEHDNHGIGAGWMLDRVEVTNLVENSTVVFPCQQWLDKKKGDKQLFRELYPQIL